MLGRTIWKMQALLCLCTFFVLPSVYPDVASSQPSPAEELRPCIGYRRSDSTWGLTGVSPNRPEDFCDAGEAFVYHVPIVGKNAGPGSVPPEGTCCPLPKGALSEVHVFAVDECPSQSVVTGGRYQGRIEQYPGHYLYEVRCTFLNKSAFRLEEEAEVVRLEYGRQPRLDFSSPSPKRWIHRQEIPEYLRNGVGRSNPLSWLPSGCLGVPWGSVLTKIGRNGCQGFRFHVLRQVSLDYVNSPGSTKR